MLEDIKQVVRKDLKMKHGEGPTNDKMNDIISNYYVASQLTSKKPAANQEEFDDIEEQTPPKGLLGDNKEQQYQNIRDTMK